MALSPQDYAFYHEKLKWKAFLWLFFTTTAMGAIFCPVLLYYQDYSIGQTGKWSWRVIGELSLIGVMLGTIVSLIMFFLARFYLWMGWLPRRR